MSTPKEVSPSLYRSHMHEVKLRFRAIDRILGAKKPRTLSAEFDNEFLWLQVRQIIELVSFSAMLADEARYAAMRAAHGGSSYEQDWRAGRILERLSKVSPHFLPQALGKVVVRDGLKEFQGTAQKATLDRLVSMYDRASQHLHATNPANIEGLLEQATRRAASRAQLTEDVGYLRSILWEHYKVGLQWEDGDKPTEAANPDRVWIVRFGKADAPSVEMFEAMQTDSA